MFHVIFAVYTATRDKVKSYSKFELYYFEIVCTCNTEYQNTSINTPKLSAAGLLYSVTCEKRQ